jgi:hypothetical protein
VQYLRGRYAATTDRRIPHRTTIANRASPYFWISSNVAVARYPRSLEFAPRLFFSTRQIAQRYHVPTAVERLRIDTRSCQRSSKRDRIDESAGCCKPLSKTRSLIRRLRGPPIIFRIRSKYRTSNLFRRLAVFIELPIPSWLLTWRIENRPLEELIIHRCF